MLIESSEMFPVSLQSADLGSQHEVDGVGLNLPSTLAEKKDSFDVFLKATLPRPATLCPALVPPILPVTSFNFSCIFSNPLL